MWLSIYVIVINHNFIFWCSKKQSVEALSSFEAAYGFLEPIDLEALLFEIFSTRNWITIFKKFWRLRGLNILMLGFILWKT